MKIFARIYTVTIANIYSQQKVMVANLRAPQKMIVATLSPQKKFAMC
uniref:Uncharacterized protein n=1 Tax=Octopus bimaculoides TaxID=37653 RepID=A0A0L8FVT6_OCTBM